MSDHQVILFNNWKKLCYRYKSPPFDMMFTSMFKTLDDLHRTKYYDSILFKLIYANAKRNPKEFGNYIINYEREEPDPIKNKYIRALKHDIFKTICVNLNKTIMQM